MAIATPNKARAKSGTTSAESVWDEIRLRLEHRRDEILERIGSYPTPIPACDVDFNRLLEERAQVFEELDRLATLRRRGSHSRGSNVAQEFIASCISLSEDDRHALRALR